MQNQSSIIANAGYRQRNWLYLANPVLKFVLVLLLAFAGLWVQQLNTLIAISGFYLLLFILFANLSWRWLCWLVLLVLLMSFLSGINLFLFGSGDDVIWQFAWWKISHQSIQFGLIVIFRTLLMSMLGLLFSTTTQPTLFCYALMQQLRLSPNIAYGCLAAMRMFPLLAEEFQQLQKALKIRGMKQRRGIKQRWQWVKRMMLILLAQAIRRSYRTALAVVTKQFDAKAKRTYYYHTNVTKYDGYLLFLLLIGNIAPIYYFGF